MGRATPFERDVLVLVARYELQGQPIRGDGAVITERGECCGPQLSAIRRLAEKGMIKWVTTKAGKIGAVTGPDRQAVLRMAALAMMREEDPQTRPNEDEIIGWLIAHRLTTCLGDF